MSKFRQSTITTAGKQVLFGDGTVTYTKAVLYSQDLSQMDSDQLKALTSLTGELKTTPLGIKDNTGNTVIVSADFTNAGQKEDIEFKSVGWFAKTSDAETLIAVSPVDGTATLGAGSPDGTSTDAVSLSMSMAIGDATTVNVVVNPAGTVSPSDLESAFKANEDKLLGKFFTLEQETELENAIIDNYYDKPTIDEKLADKADKTAIDYEISEINKQVDTKANSSDLDDYEKSSDLVEQLKSYATNDSVTKGLALKADQSSVAELLKGYTTSADLAKLLDGKADKSTTYTKTDVDDKLAVKVDKTALDAEIAKLQASIDTKADRADLDSKIDAVNKAVATKANTADTYSKAELDKKLLAMSTDTNGKVSAEQVTKMLADKADSSDVYVKKDIDDKLAVKVDKTALDAEIAKIQASVDSKASKADLNAIDFSKIKFRKQYDKGNFTTADKTWSAVKQKDGTYIVDLYSDDWTACDLVTLANEVRSQHYTKTEVDSRINALKPSITDASNQAKHAQDSANSAQATANNALPKAGGNMNLRSTINWNGGGINDKTGNLGGLRWSGGTDSASIYGDQNNSDNLDLAIDLGDDGSNHVSFRQNGKETSAITSDGHFTGTVDWGHVNGRPADTVTVINSYDVANNKEGPHNRWPVGQAWYVDQTALHPFADAINNINSTRTPLVNGGNGDDLLAFKTNQIRLYPGNGKTCKNLPPAQNTQWFTIQYVFENPNGDGIAIFRSPANEIWTIGNNGGTYNTGWLRVANANDVNNLQNQINTLKTQLNDAVNTINYLKQNMVIGRHFNNEQQAQDWYNANQNGIAFIDK